MYLPRNRTSWDKYMLKDISKYKFYGRSQLVRLRGKYTVQTAHCALTASVCGAERTLLKTPTYESHQNVWC